MIGYRKALPTKTKGSCDACGCWETYRSTFELEPGGHFQSQWKSRCVKRRGFCQLTGHYLNMEEQKAITVKVTDVVTGRKFERREIV